MGKSALWHLMFGRALVVSSARLQMFGWSVSKFKSDSTHLLCPKCCWCCSPNCPLMAECCCMLSFPMNFSSCLNIEVQALRWRRHVPMSWDDYSPNWVVSGCLDHQRLVPRFSVEIVKERENKMSVKIRLFNNAKDNKKKERRNSIQAEEMANKGARIKVK